MSNSNTDVSFLVLIIREWWKTVRYRIMMLTDWVN